MIRGDLPQTVKAIHEEYGQVVRVAPDELSFTDPRAWRDIHGKNLERPPKYKGKPPGKNAENLITANESDHTRFRKVLAPAFSQRAMHDQEDAIQGHINLMIEKLHQTIKDDVPESAVVVNMLKWFNYTTFDIIGDLFWSSSFDCLNKVRYHPWLQITQQFKTVMIMTTVKFYPPLDSILQMIIARAAMRPLMEIWRTTEQKLAQRMATIVKRPDIVSHIKATNESMSDFYMTQEEIEINAMTLVVGGSEPVTTALTGTINYLLREPTKFKALIAEIRSSFHSEDEITGFSVNRLPYLNAVILEGIRVCTTTADGMRRLIPKGGTTVAGHHLPGGTVVSIPQWATYRSSSNFYSPDSFLPERWLPGGYDSGSPFRNDRKDSFNPFSLGAYNCPGRSLAYLEMRLILAKMVWNFDMEIPPGINLPAWDKQGNWWFWDKQDTYVKIGSAR